MGCGPWAVRRRVHIGTCSTDAAHGSSRQVRPPHRTEKIRVSSQCGCRGGHIGASTVTVGSTQPTLIEEESDGSDRSEGSLGHAVVPVGTLRYWRHSNIGPASFTLVRRVVYRREEVLRWISQREKATRRGAATPRDLNLWERPRGLAEVYRSNRPLTQHGIPL